MRTGQPCKHDEWPEPKGSYTNHAGNHGNDLLGVASVALMFVLPSLSAAAPNPRSEATIQACQTEGTQTATVCSTKELSNVVVQCTSDETGTSFVKYDDLDEFEIPYAEEGVDFSLETAYLGNFSCPEGSTLTAVFVKSGSKKAENAPTGLPPGSGAMWGLGDCSTFVCATPVEDEEKGEEEEISTPPAELS